MHTKCSLITTTCTHTHTHTRTPTGTKRKLFLSELSYTLVHIYKVTPKSHSLSFLFNFPHLIQSPFYKRKIIFLNNKMAPARLKRRQRKISRSLFIFGWYEKTDKQMNSAHCFYRFIGRWIRLPNPVGWSDSTSSLHSQQTYVLVKKLRITEGIMRSTLHVAIVEPWGQSRA